MTTYSLEAYSGDRQKIVDSTGGVGSVYVRCSNRNSMLRYRIGIAPAWNTSTRKPDSTVLFLHLDGSLVSGHLNWGTEEHDVFTSSKEASEALAKFMAAGCPGLTLENLSANKAFTKAHNSSVKAKKAEGILRGMELADLVALRKAVDAAIAKKTPKK